MAFRKFFSLKINTRKTTLKVTYKDLIWITIGDSSSLPVIPFSSRTGRHPETNRAEKTRLRTRGKDQKPACCRFTEREEETG